MNALSRRPGAGRRDGAAGRARAVTEFGWDAIARQTVELYQSLI